MPASQPDSAPAADDTAPAAPVVFEQTLEEFCSAISVGNAYTMELIAGFYSDEIRQGRRKALAEAFQADLDTFAGRPVQRA